MSPKRTPEDVWNTVRGLVGEMVDQAGVELEEIQPDTMLRADLGLSSVDTIHMVMSLEERFGDDLDLEALMMRGDEQVGDLSMRELHGFLCRQLEVADGGP